MATVTDRQKKALGIFQLVLELLLSLFKAHHAKDIKNASEEDAK